jgi:hypothetical protein
MPGPFDLLKAGAWVLAGLCLGTSLWIGGRQPGCDVFFAVLAVVWLAIARQAGALVPKSGKEAYQPSAT